MILQMDYYRILTNYIKIIDESCLLLQSLLAFYQLNLSIKFSSKINLIINLLNFIFLLIIIRKMLTSPKNIT